MFLSSSTVLIKLNTFSFFGIFAVLVGYLHLPAQGISFVLPLLLRRVLFPVPVLQFRTRVPKTPLLSLSGPPKAGHTRADHGDDTTV
jgi:hypothetical protein